MKTVFVSLALLALCQPVLAQSVKTQTTKGVDLLNYETFTVEKGEFMTPPDEQRTSEDSLFAALKKTVVRELELRGYRYVGDSTAQMTVSYVAGSYNFTDGGNVGPLGDSPASTPADMDRSRSWTRETREGMIVIDISDTRNKKELWKATSNLTIDYVDLTRALDAVVYKSFKKFPNRKKHKK